MLAAAAATTTNINAVLCSETNLKVRQALPCTADMIEIDQLSRFDGQLDTHTHTQTTRAC